MSIANLRARVILIACLTAACLGMEYLLPRAFEEKLALSQMTDGDFNDKNNAINSGFNSRNSQVKILYEFGISDDYIWPQRIFNHSRGSLYGVAYSGDREGQVLFQFHPDLGMKELHQFRYTKDLYTTFPASSQEYERELYFANPVFGFNETLNNDYIGVVLEYSLDTQDMKIVLSDASTKVLRQGVMPLQPSLLATENGFLGSFHTSSEEISGLYRVDRSGEFQFLNTLMPVPSFLGHDGLFYGITKEYFFSLGEKWDKSVAKDCHVIYRMNQEGKEAEIYFSFREDDSFCSYVTSITGNEYGDIYGEVTFGKEYDGEAIFILDRDGKISYPLKHTFGEFNNMHMVEGEDGSILASAVSTLSLDGRHQKVKKRTVVFELDRDGNMEVLAELPHYIASLIKGEDGHLYGITNSALTFSKNDEDDFHVGWLFKIELN